MSQTDPWSRLTRADNEVKQRLLAEAKEVLRTAPTNDKVGSGREELVAWAGRAAAVIRRWNQVQAVVVPRLVEEFLDDNLTKAFGGFTMLKALLHQAEAELTFEVGPTSTVVPQHMVFDYFDEVRKVIEAAREDVFFVDAYLDADFVPRYLPFVASGASIRLLAGTKKLDTLLPAVDMFAQQHKRAVEVRSTSTIHERYVFVDRRQCYVSGASFKDGARTAPALLMQIVDAFGPLWKTYDDAWQAAKVERHA